MKIDFNEIKNLLAKGNLSEVSRQTGIAYRTLQDWKLENNKWLVEAEERLSKLQTYINKGEKKMVTSLAFRYKDLIKMGVIERGEELEGRVHEIPADKYLEGIKQFEDFVFVQENVEKIGSDTVTVEIEQGTGIESEIYRLNRVE